jgi:hypothetical protein
MLEHSNVENSPRQFDFDHNTPHCLSCHSERSDESIFLIFLEHFNIEHALWPHWSGKTREKFLLKARGMDSHGPQTALGMTESCPECR